MAKKEIIRYIRSNIEGKPSQTINMLLEELASSVNETMHFDSTLTKIAHPGHRKIRITLKVEAV